MELHGVKLINIKVLDDAGMSSDIDVLAAINYAVEQQVDIISAAEFWWEIF